MNAPTNIGGMMIMIVIILMMHLKKNWKRKHLWGQNLKFESIC